MATSAFQAPSVRELWPVLTAQRLYHRPVFLGSEHIPRARPVLYVGNHTLFGVLDPPLLMAHIYEETGHLPRSLADHFHYRVPGWRDFLTRWGAVRGTRENCRAVMRAGDSVLVFPGGGREVAKRRGEAYQLLWKQRTGFVRMAVEHGYPIVPFASVGAEECYSIHLDANDLEELGVGNCLTRGLLGKVTRRGELLVPIATGAFGTPFPRRQRFYYAFGAPIETGALHGRMEDDAAMLALQQRVKVAVEGLIADCQEERARRVA
ncbi:MAG: hypothetical protein RL385_419 [Pseudomonadota bacterium]